jgi:hypothetical protein
MNRLKTVLLLLLCLISFLEERFQVIQFGRHSGADIHGKDVLEIMALKNSSEQDDIFFETGPDGFPSPETFMPGIISTDSLEFNAAFSPDGNYFYFARSINGKTTILVSKKTGIGWSIPEPVSFSTAKFSDADPAFSPTGELYFISNRPLNAKDTTKDYDIWKVIPVSTDQWSEPVNVASLNSGKNEFYISFTENGDVYFSSSREGGYGEEDIYSCETKDNAFSVPQNLGYKVNSIHSEYDPFITADGSVLLFASSGRKDSFGKADLYWSVKANHVWAVAEHFEKDLNTPTRDFCPYITFDQKHFFYSSMGDVKFIPTAQLPRAIAVSFKNK